jgi:hypothetical protein
MSDDNTQDGAEPSPASVGSHSEPVGWQATDEFGRPAGFLSWKDDETRWPKNESVPLYLQPKPALTDEEREALNRGIDALYGVEDVSDGACRRDDAAARTLLALLERLK